MCQEKACALMKFFIRNKMFITQVIDTPGRLYYNINVCIQSIEDPLAPDLYIEIVLLY